jgi:hypothetical protein
LVGANTLVDAYEIDSQAKMVEYQTDIVRVDTNKVLIFVVHEEKIIYLWRGNNAQLFEKLMATRVAAFLSHKYPDYRIRPIKEGAEPASFKHLIGEKVG